MTIKKYSIIGKTYGFWTVLSKEGYRSNENNLRYLCRCSCGDVRAVLGNHLVNGQSKSCGCKIKYSFKDITGERFGKLVALQLAEQPNKAYGKYWLCLCDCGKKKVIAGQSLRKGSTKSCGCISFEKRALPEGESSFNALYLRYRNNATKRKLCFELDKEQFKTLTKKNCTYCGSVPSQIFSGHIKCNGSYIYNGIDRIDSNRGYVIDNVTPCCGLCNQAKYNNSVEYFKYWISRVYFMLDSKNLIPVKSTKNIK
jgi:hypothetical protein